MSLSSCISDCATQGFTVETVVSGYLSWIVKSFYYVIYGYNAYSQKYEYKAIRGVKRGDDRYAYATMRRFSLVERVLTSVMGSEEFFSRGEHDRDKILSPLVFASLTYRRDISIEDSWQKIGIDLNRYLSGLRRKYGKISIVRVFESQEEGYAHLHLLMYFHYVQWQGFRHWDLKRGRFVFRVDRVSEFKRGWRGGFSDVSLMRSAADGYSYTKKYVTKAVEFDKADSKVTKTLALSWYFHKRSFSISGDLSASYSDLNVTTNGNSNAEPKFLAHFKQLDGGVLVVEVEKWGLYGIMNDPPDFPSGIVVEMDADEVVFLQQSGVLMRR